MHCFKRKDKDRYDEGVLEDEFGRLRSHEGGLRLHVALLKRVHSLEDYGLCFLEGLHLKKRV